MIPELLSEKEAAEKLQVARRTLAVWRCTKRYGLRFVRIGRKIRYRSEDITAFIESRTMPGDGSEATPRRRRRGSR